MPRQHPVELEPAENLRRACADLERRLGAGEACVAEDLFATFPELESESESALELIYTEFVVRERLGQRPDTNAWYARFPQWRADLEQLFQIHRAVGPSEAVVSSNVETSPLQGGEVPAGSCVGRRVGNYELLEELGRGGMGVVYRARQVGLGRIVAVKLILAGDYCGPQELGRFRIEAGAAAHLQHPNIVQVHEVGDQDGRPYLSLELVDGGSLEEKLAAAPWAGQDAARLVEVLAVAMHYAHEHGVIHRDLKPANILLSRKSEGRTPKSEKEGAATVSDFRFRISDFEPKVTDFGLARRLPEGDTAENTRDGLTATGAILGTPSYMAPEQAAGRSHDVGPAADVYALGAILYAVLTGRPPFRGVTPLETLEQVRSEEPVPPRRLQPKVPRDLDTICLSCLHKEPSKRYASAQALADDLHRFLAGEPIHARPVGSRERVVKWARRRPTVAALMAAVVTVAAAGLAASLCSWYQTLDALQRTEQAREREHEAHVKTEGALADKTVALARQAWMNEDPDQTGRLLEECPPAYRGREWRYLDRACHGCLLCLPPGTARTQYGGVVVWSPDGVYLASTATSETKPKNMQINLWDAATGRRVRTFDALADVRLATLAFTASGRQLVVAGSQVTAGGTFGGIPMRTSVRVLDLLSGEEQHNGMWSLTKAKTYLSEDGRYLALQASERVIVWDVTADKELPKWPRTRGASEAMAAQGARRVIAACSEDTLGLWDVTTGEPVGSKLSKAGFICALAFSSSGSRLAGVSQGHRITAAGSDWFVSVWDLETGREILRFPTPDRITNLSLNRDGTRLAGCVNRTVIVWDAATGQEQLTFRGRIPACDLAFSPDGTRLASVGLDSVLRVWDVQPLE